ncbi:S8 family serine peptidase [Streptomyces orinoci]|uniref:S8 family serine peptidase n=1 Tax=Streptomyces orinoci TaxID=67339 RepID=A0ABV3K5Q6_STRON|nr:S8 family serine peptidase [Streptomyces orinoci]
MSAASTAMADVRSHEWYLDDMQAEAMWKVSTGKGITVAVLDSGVDATLPELRHQIVGGADLSSHPTGPLKDMEGHGTDMAAIIAGDGSGGGIQGIAPGVKVLPVKFDRIGGEAMARGIRYAVDQHAQVINISMGWPAASTQANDVQQAVNYALQKGSLVFASSGNDGDNGNMASYPAALPGVVSVGAIDRNGDVTKFSTHGPQLALAAYGQDVVGHCKDDRSQYCLAKGTSPASAFASAAAALIWSKHPEWTNNQVLRVMMETAGKPSDGQVPSEYLGYGIVRPRKVLLEGQGDPGPADVNPLPRAQAELHGQSSAGAPATLGKDKGSATHKADVDSAAESASSGSSGHLMTWIGIGSAVAVVIAATTAFLIARRRRATVSQPPHPGAPQIPPMGGAWRDQ